LAKSKGRLVAVEGIHGPDLVKAGRQLLKAAGCPRERSGISVWDASGIFFELSQTRQKLGVPSAKTLLILYASDLAFRLRWEIEPALAEGRTVLAAPYVETAIAAGAAAGIPRSWTTSLLRFAPAAEAEFRIKEKMSEAGWTARRSGGFGEYFALAMKTLFERDSAADVRDRMLAYWKYDPRAEHLRPLNDKSLERVRKHGL
jgi:hypothetical protein